VYFGCVGRKQNEKETIHRNRGKSKEVLEYQSQFSKYI
jgi:hypothetical protein